MDSSNYIGANYGGTRITRLTRIAEVSSIGNGGFIRSSEISKRVSSNLAEFAVHMSILWLRIFGNVPTSMVHRTGSIFLIWAPIRMKLWQRMNKRLNSFETWLNCPLGLHDFFQSKPSCPWLGLLPLLPFEIRLICFLYHSLFNIHRPFTPLPHL